jgi:hypothetical protein
MTVHDKLNNKIQYSKTQYDVQYNDVQDNDAQYNNTRYNNTQYHTTLQNNKIQHSVLCPICNPIRLKVINYTDCHYAECRNQAH